MIIHRNIHPPTPIKNVFIKHQFFVNFFRCQFVYSVFLSLSNNTSVVGTLRAAHARFARLLRARAHVHHYTDYMDADAFAVAGETLAGVADAYAEVQRE